MLSFSSRPSGHLSYLTGDHYALIIGARRLASSHNEIAPCDPHEVPVLTPADCPEAWRDDLGAGRTPAELLDAKPLTHVSSRRVFQWLFFLWHDLVPMPLEVIPCTLAYLSAGRLSDLVRGRQATQPVFHTLALPRNQRSDILLRDPPAGVIFTNLDTIACLVHRREQMHAAGLGTP